MIWKSAWSVRLSHNKTVSGILAWLLPKSNQYQCPQEMSYISSKFSIRNTQSKREFLPISFDWLAHQTKLKLRSTFLMVRRTPCWWRERKMMNISTKWMITHNLWSLIIWNFFQVILKQRDKLSARRKRH